MVRLRKSSGERISPKGCRHVELVASGVEGRVGQHRDTVEDDAVKQVRPADIAPASPLVGLTLLVVEEEGAVLVGVRHRHYRLVRTDHRTHRTANAGVGHSGFLADADKGPVFVGPLLAQDLKLGHPLPPVGQADGPLRTDRGAAAAESATILTMFNDPG